MLQGGRRDSSQLFSRFLVVAQFEPADRGRQVVGIWGLEGHGFKKGVGTARPHLQASEKNNAGTSRPRPSSSGLIALAAQQRFTFTAHGGPSDLDAENVAVAGDFEHHV